MKRIIAVSMFWCWVLGVGLAQIPDNFQWMSTRDAYRDVVEGQIVEVAMPGQKTTVLVTDKQLTPAGANAPLDVVSYTFSTDESKVLVYTNSQRVWRYETRGDYWLLDRKTGQLAQLGKGLPASSMMFAKLSPDGTKVAYVSKNNLYMEDLGKPGPVALTKDGTDRLINGTFDWVYEEEFDCRDGFRWNPDSKTIAYWQIDARQIRNFLMINNTDSIYAFNVPVEYPKVGEAPSPYKIGVVDVKKKKTRWMAIPGDPRQTYLPRAEWTPTGTALVLQQLNRKQNNSKLLYANPATGQVSSFYEESDEAWIDIQGPAGWSWTEGGKSFMWTSEKDGWRHVYRISSDGKTEKCITSGNYDVISVAMIDEAHNKLFFMASPDNATQAYLYVCPLDGSSPAKRVSPASQPGTHRYDVSTSGTLARHTFSNAKTPYLTEWVSLPDHKTLPDSKSIDEQMASIRVAGIDIEFFQVTTADNITLDAWITRPSNFDPTKKYPIVFMVYGEPASSTVRDVYGTGRNRLYTGNMADDGYIYASMDNRGTPSPKGRAWRKAIYRNIGRINIRDQAMAAREFFKRFDFIDTSRVAVHGWSGGGSSTLNLLFQYPETFKTGISIAAVANQLSYDNIYQERYMGIPQENREDFVAGSPITHAKNLVGNLLYIHGTGDDNVHYQNAEMLVNELIKHNKQFQFMAYPNRSHGIREGTGTTQHLATLFTQYLKKHCPPGGR